MRKKLNSEIDKKFLFVDEFILTEKLTKKCEIDGKKVFTKLINFKSTFREIDG
jgi:hypothetical protein